LRTILFSDQKLGNNIINPNIVITPPENQVQKELGISINKVEAFSTKVKIITERAKEKIIRMDFLDIFLEVSTLLDPMMIGSKGNIHGASIVKIPAKTEMKKNSMTS